MEKDFMNYQQDENYELEKSDDDIGFDFDEPTLLAREKFAVQFLFPWQRFVIANILDSAKLLAFDEDFSLNEDDEIYCRGRQIVLLPTGSGKSMCFLVPSLILPGATLVFYPLLALMADQKRRMDEAGIPCVIFRGGQSREERERNFSLLADGAKVILANPEVLQNEELLARLSKFKISHIAIDEAHCVFEWGSTFRPAYLTVRKIIAALGAKIITAFTATASPVVLEQIGKIIFDSHFHLVKSESDRPNIHYEVKYAFAKEKAALECAATYRRPMIVFCGTRDRAEKMARNLSEHFGRDKARFYHAGMTKEEKLSTEKWFFDSDEGVLAATCAYGMGMDKGNIYTVVHLDVPSHMENFCQEAGRAGRKGDEVRSVLIWNYSDTLRFGSAPPESRERIMGEYALSGGCRRQLMLDYLGGEKTVCSGCDICDARQKGEKIDFKASDGELAFSFIRKNRRILTHDRAVKEITDMFNEKKRAIFGKNVWETDDTEEILEQLVLEKRIKICGGIWKNLVDIGARQKKNRFWWLESVRAIRSRFDRAQPPNVAIIRRHLLRLAARSAQELGLEQELLS